MRNYPKISAILLGLLITTSAIAQSSTTSAMNAGGGSTGADGSTNSSNNHSWNSQSTYWRNNYTSRPYYNKSRDYSAYEPAYRYGVDLYNQNPGKSYEQLNQSQIKNGWNSARGNSSLEWNDAQQATRDAYTHLYNNQNNSNSAGSSPTTRPGITHQ